MEFVSLLPSHYVICYSLLLHLSLSPLYLSWFLEKWRAGRPNWPWSLAVIVEPLCVECSLVNQPYFSCAHISRSVHARDEGAGKIRLAKPARVQEPERNVAAKIN